MFGYPARFCRSKRDFLGYLTFVFSFVTNSLVMGVAESLYKAMSHEMVDFWHLCCDKLGFIGEDVSNSWVTRAARNFLKEVSCTFKNFS